MGDQPSKQIALSSVLYEVTQVTLLSYRTGSNPVNDDFSSIGGDHIVSDDFAFAVEDLFQYLIAIQIKRKGVEVCHEF